MRLKSVMFEPMDVIRWEIFSSRYVKFDDFFFVFEHMTIACSCIRYECLDDSLLNKRSVGDAISDLAELSLRSIRKVR